MKEAFGPAGQGRHAEDGARARSGAGGRHPGARLDDRRDQEAGARRSCTPIANKIGYPDKWRDYSALTIERGDALGNSQRANAFEFRRQLNKIGKPVDKSEWSMTPPTVNAYYNPLENNINFPAGILQPPFYDAKADAAVNFGGIGARDRPRADARLRRPGPPVRRAAATSRTGGRPSDAKAFEERAQCFVDQYSGFTAVDDVKVNGKLTLGENIADNGGLRIALMAYVASLTPAAAQDARRLHAGAALLPRLRPGLVRERAARTRAHAGADQPALARPTYRVNGVVSNMPEFQKAFSCKAGAPMVRKNACRVW